MNDKMALDLLNELIDERITMYGMLETIDYLYEIGATPRFIIDELHFAKEDVDNCMLDRFGEVEYE